MTVQHEELFLRQLQLAHVEPQTELLFADHSGTEFVEIFEEFLDSDPVLLDLGSQLGQQGREVGGGVVEADRLDGRLVEQLGLLGHSLQMFELLVLRVEEAKVIEINAKIAAKLQEYCCRPYFQ